MKKWNVNCDGWYPYCPVCGQESFYRTPICMNCRTILEGNKEDMEELKATHPELYDEILVAYEERLMAYEIGKGKWGMVKS